MSPVNQPWIAQVPAHVTQLFQARARLGRLVSRYFTRWSDPRKPSTHVPVQVSRTGDPEQPGAPPAPQRWYRLLNELPAIVYVKAPDYTIQFANRLFRERFGEPGGQPCYQVIHGRTAPCDPCGCQDVLQDQELVQWEWTFEDGASFQIYDYPLLDVDGSQMVLQLGIDITPRKQAEANLERANEELRLVTRAEREQRRFAEGLAQAVLALNSSLNWTEVLDRILEQTLQVIPCSAAIIMLLQDGRVCLSRQLSARFAPEELARWQEGISLSELPLFERMCRDRRPIIVREEDDVGRFPGSLLSRLSWPRSLVAVPMACGDAVIGAITLLSEERGFFSQESVTRLEAFASHAALAIENARLYESEREAARRTEHLARRLVQAQEQERRYVARELHDEAGQALTSLLIQLKLLENQAPESQQVRNSLAGLVGEVESLMENLHRLSVALHPSSLDRLGLVAALRQHCSALNNQNGIRIAFEAEGIASQLPAEVETAVYRIVQEALSNAVRHSKATRVAVSIGQHRNRILAKTEDNGVGFDPAQVTRADHIGLIGMRERAETLGGTLTIESRRGAGTSVVVEVPYVYQDPPRG